MSAPNPSPYKTWWQQVVGAAIPWLAGGVNGQAEGNAWPAFLDYLLTLLIAARYQAYPDYCAPDALTHLAGDRMLVQGPSETNANLITRIKTAWGNSPITLPPTQTGLPAVQPGGPSSGWALAGTWLQLLEELYWGGFGGDNSGGSLIHAPVIVQQNGLADYLTGIPTAGADNRSVWASAATAVLPGPIVSSVNTFRTIPAGNSWFWFDGNTDLCSRFAIIWPTAPATYPWSTALLAQLQKLITTWRPNAVCYGAFVVTAGRTWDWPVTTWDGYGGNWDSPSTVVQVLQPF
jgi:hypothetical protein